MPDSYYDILGVARDASEKDIRSAYRRLARKLHPDVNPGNAAAGERFKKVNEAYEILSEVRTRKDYDEFGPNWKHADDLRKAGARAGGAQGGYPGAQYGHLFPGYSRSRRGQRPQDFTEFIDMFDVGDLGRGMRRAQPETQELETAVTLDEAYRGTTRLIALDRGDGTQTRLEVKVPAGIADGGRVRIRPQGGLELQIVVRVQPDPRFRREGADLHAEAPVPLVTAVLGGEVEVPTMTGSVVLKVPAGTQNGRSFRIAGKGMPRLGASNSFGDLYATVKVMLPESLMPEEKKLFEKLRELQAKGRASHV